MAIARQLDLDLVEVAAEANPPVCRIMDYSRFKYEANQRAKESRRKTTSTSIKEMKYRPKIGTGDFDTKTRQVARFLGDGHKVKITIMFRGREMSHPELGKRILDQVAETVGPTAKVEAAPKLDGRNMIMVLAPDRRAQQAAAKAARSAGATSSGEASPDLVPPGALPPDAPLNDELSLDDGTLDDETLDDVSIDVSIDVSPEPSEALITSATTNGGAGPGADHLDGPIEVPAVASTEEP
jgi:translation initiation factor IF-3